MKKGAAISAIVITRNEQDTIGRCLGSLAPVCREIVVVDSLSTDRTAAIARTFTDHVVEHEWVGYSRQKQIAVEHCTCDWIFWVDADEQVSDELAREIGGLDFSADGYYVPRKVWYMGRWIMHCGWYPGHVLRLFDRARGSFSPALVHERVELDGKAAFCCAPLLHYPYRDFTHHLEKMNAFTTLAAQQMLADGRRVSLPVIALHTLGKFVNMYLVRQGFRDGAAGFTVSALGSFYVFLKYAKLYEMKRQETR
jgi:glycosyltransferase involved in cell wall biosynthesis